MNFRKSVFYLFLFFSISFFQLGWAQLSSVKVILTGNTIDLKTPGEILEIISNYCEKDSSTVIWVLNGDIFPNEFDENNIKSWKNKLESLLDKFPQLTIVLNQGDRDWNDSDENGWEHIRMLDNIFEKDTHPRLKVFFENGCPGPWDFTIVDQLEIVVFNSQWWNHPYDKPLPSNAICDIANQDVFMEEVRDILDESDNKNILVLSHFPLESLGNYGGRFPISTYLLPPIVGSIDVSFHQNIGTKYDLVNEHFDDFRNDMSDLLLDYGSLIFASAHEKNHSS